MLDIKRYLSLPGVPGVVIYEDDEQNDGFYLVAESPRFLSPEGLPQVSLAVYGSGSGDTFRSSGGFFACTTSLGLSPEQRQQAEDSLTKRLREHSGPEVSPVSILGVDWTAGRAKMRLSPDRVVNGQPSLTGENACVFQHVLTGVEAADLDSRWCNGEGGIEVVYELRAAARGLPDGADFVLSGYLPLSAELHGTCVRYLSVE